MRFGNPTPIATEVARGDFHGSGEDNEPKALSATRRGDHPRRLAGGPARRSHRFAHAPSPAPLPVVARTGGPVAHSPLRGARGARTANRFPTPSCLRYVEN